MERSEFISKLGLGLAVVCTGCMAACGSKSSDATPSGNAPNPPAQGSGNLFTVNLDNELQTIGSSKVSNGVIIVRILDGDSPSSFTAVQVACTHEGNAIGYNNGQGIFICPVHGSEFSKTGQVLLGPAARALHKYNVTIDGSTLTVSA